jgi:arabinogalactan endo-1,4-beta-galactosidase
MLQLNILKISSKSLLALAIAGAVALNTEAKKPNELWLGADISGTTADEARGVYSTDTLGVVTENTQLMKNYGMNAVRLRVWVNPRGGWSSKQDVLTMAQRAKALGMEIMIDFHYSDWWADPEKQIIPAAWKDFNLNEMKQALANHTIETLQLIKDNGINVKWVQVGNETRDGFLWPMGQLSKGNMANYAALTIAGYDAVKSVYPNAQVIVHIDNGFDNPTYNEIFDGLKANGAKWDIIGMSVYPYWAIKYNHEPDAASTLRDAIDNIRKLNEKYGCKVMIVETGVDSSKPEEGLEFMNSLFDAVINDANGACTGVFYWAPEAFQVKTPDGSLEGYALGAFDNRHPTAILNSYPRAARLMQQ